MTILCLPLPTNAFRKTPHDTPQGNKSHYNSWTQKYNHCLHYFVQRPRHVFEESQANLQDLVINSVHQHLHPGPKKAVCHSHQKGFAKNTHLSHRIKGVYRAGAHGVFPWLDGAGWRILVFFLEYLRNNMKQANCGTQMDPNGTSFGPQYWSYVNYPNLSIWGVNHFESFHFWNISQDIYLAKSDFARGQVVLGEVSFTSLNCMA